MSEKSDAGSSKPWFKKKRFIIPIVIVIIIIGASGGGTSSNEENNNTSPTQEKVQTEPVSKRALIGAEVRDGKFAFVIKEIKCGITKVGSGSFSAKAQGQYCAVSMNVSNIGKEPQTFFGSNQKAFDTEGREFSNDTSADLYDSDSQTWLKEINPGNALTGKVYFDIPKDAVIDYVELHDSIFSSGVKVYTN